jgi:2-C-methyl-D-erythritol 4-phosphate cytidylyltransferase
VVIWAMGEASEQAAAVPTACIIVAAGRGERLGAGEPKALRLLAEQPLVMHAARAALDSGVVDILAVAAPVEFVDDVASAVRLLGGRLVTVPGGDTRRASVAAALAGLPAEVEVVLVHDAARCLAPAGLFVAVARAAAGGLEAVVPVLPVADTIKVVEDDVVTRTLDRSALRAVQTPQGFRRDILVRAHAAASGDATDDAGLVEQLGGVVHVVPGHQEAFKVTTPLDLLLAEIVLAHRSGGAT